MSEDNKFVDVWLPNVHQAPAQAASNSKMSIPYSKIAIFPKFNKNQKYSFLSSV